MVISKLLRPITRRERLLNEIQQLEKEVEVLGSPELNKQDLEELLVPYENALIDEEFAELTIQKYLNVPKEFIEKYAGESSVDKRDVMKYKNDMLNAGLMASTVNNKITALNRFLYYCELGNLAVKGVKAQDSNVLEYRLYQHEFKRLYTRAKTNGDMQLHYLIKIIGGTGIRIGERKWFTTSSIKKSDIQITHKGKTRIVPLPGPLARELRAWAELEGIEGELITLSYDQIYKRLKDLAGQCKIKKAKVHPHSFRSYFGFRFIDINGHSKLAQLADIYGHTSIETTRRYTRGTKEDYKKTMEEM